MRREEGEKEMKVDGAIITALKCRLGMTQEAVCKNGFLRMDNQERQVEKM